MAATIETQRPSILQAYATLDQMREWAAKIMLSRKPDYVIGQDYLRRWWVIPRNEFCNVYLHQFLHSDDDRALHDHPWENSSHIIDGSYIEHTPEGSFIRKAGEYVERPANALHRIELINDEPVISLFITGPKIREWGFACPQGWVPWQEFTAPGDSSQTGRGCWEP